MSLLALLLLAWSTGALCYVPKAQFAAKSLRVSSFLMKNPKIQHQRVRKQRSSQYGSITMLRNFDLPETLIFYGFDTVVETNTDPSTTPTLRAGVKRLIEEGQELDIPTIILSEHLSMSDLASEIEIVEPMFAKYREKGLLHYRSGLEEFPVDDSGIEYDYYVPTRFLGEGIGHSPCSGALFDALNTITVEPKGFGGSGGFGVKHWEAQRIPFPQHCVVFVSSASDKGTHTFGSIDRRDGSESISHDRCVASRAAGMRSIYVEDETLACTAEGLTDGVVESLGTDQDWEMVTIDDISTPGSFWLNMAQPKDENGNRVDAEDSIREQIQIRKKRLHANIDIEEKSSSAMTDDNLDEDEIAALLADIDPL